MLSDALKWSTEVGEYLYAGDEKGGGGQRSSSKAQASTGAVSLTASDESIRVKIRAHIVLYISFFLQCLVHFVYLFNNM